MDTQATRHRGRVALSLVGTRRGVGHQAVPIRLSGSPSADLRSQLSALDGVVDVNDDVIGLRCRADVSRDELVRQARHWLHGAQAA